MKDITLNILDCSLQRKIKPVQNLSLIVFTVSWVCIFIFIFFDNEWMSKLFYAFILLSIFCAILAIVLSFFFFRKKVIGKITINESILSIDNKDAYDIDNWFLDLNVNDSDGKPFTPEYIEKLPFWGNYIKNEKLGKVIEFEPKPELKKLIILLEVRNSKRPALETKTTDLFKTLMDLLWAVS